MVDIKYAKYIISVDRKFFIPQLLVACTIMASNSIFIYALRKRKKLGVITFKLIHILSIVDVFSGLADLIASVALELATTKASEDYAITSRIVGIVLYPFDVFTTFMILLLAVDRYLRMTRMNNYSLIITHRTANILVTLCALSTLFNTCIMGLSHYFHFYRWFLTALCAIGIVSVAVSFILYYTALRSLAKGMNNRSLATQNRNIRNAEREISKAVFLILTCLVLTVTPTYICTLLWLHIPTQKWITMALNTSYLTFYLNSTFNAAVMIFFSRDLRNCVREMFTFQAQ